MSKVPRSFVPVIAVVACSVFLAPLPHALYSDLVASVVSTEASSVTVAVHNPLPTPETARAHICVALDDGTELDLTSADFTVAAGDTVLVTLRASGTILSPSDDPEPFPPY